MLVDTLAEKIAKLPLEAQEDVSLFVDFLANRYAKEDEITSETTKDEREFGSARGLIQIHDGFDDPLEDFKEYMG